MELKHEFIMEWKCMVIRFDHSILTYVHRFDSRQHSLTQQGETNVTHL